MTEIDPDELPIYLDEPHSVLENVIIDGTHSNNPECAIFVRADYCIVRNVYVKNMPRIGIGARGVFQTLIERALVANCDMQGIWNERNCDGSVVRDCHVTNSGYDNIQIAGVNGSVTGCRVHGAGAGRPNYAGIYVAANARNMIVSGNYCTGNGTGIDCSWGFQDGTTRHSGLDISEGIIINGNRCVRNNACGIACASNGAIIAGNQCLDNGVATSGLSSGIGLVNADNCTILGNVMSNSAPDAQPQRVGLVFSVYGASQNISRYCVISGNHFDRNLEYPIGMFFSNRLTAAPTTLGNVVTGNYGV